jgi:hypothetical protein
VANLNDAILATTGGSTVNGGLRSFYLSNGATSGTIGDLERQFLLARGVSGGTNQDLWLKFLTGLGAPYNDGSLTDRLTLWWAAGAPLT